MLVPCVPVNDDRCHEMGGHHRNPEAGQKLGTWDQYDAGSEHDKPDKSSIQTNVAAGRAPLTTASDVAVLLRWSLWHKSTGFKQTHNDPLI